MTVSTFEKLINIFKKAFINFKFELTDELMVEVWYNELSYMDDGKAVLATKKVISTCDFVTIKNIKQAYAEIDSPTPIEDAEGWGMVERAIRSYGYPRAEEAMTSLPTQVQKAVTFMGGFKSICEAENKDVVRGQFNRAMAAVNGRARINATLGQPLLSQITKYQFAIEQQEKEKLGTQDRRTLQLEHKTLEGSRIQENMAHVAHIRDIFEQSIAPSEVQGA